MRTQSRSELSRPHDLIRAAGKLKLIKRAGWYRKAGIEECESVADHSFRTALLAAYFAEEMKLDSGKATRMALIHDLAEAETGDLLPEEKSSPRSHRMMEKESLIVMLGALPINKPSNRFLADAEELFEGRSPEARLVWKIDKLEMGAQQREYLKQGHDKSKLSQFGKKLGLPKHLRNVLDSYQP